MMELPKHYEPRDFEADRYLDTLKENAFRADPADAALPYTIVIPPPNITGRLHMGHALNNTLQDILIRYKRMKGFDVLWVPGTDHAGIATQNVVERALKEKGITRQDIGRDDFIKCVWEWRKEYGSAIIDQLKKLGSSCDWSRERFTMDEGLSDAVREVFVHLYDKGLIYRDFYIINWCPRCQTALSDIEVEHKDIEGKFYYIRYDVENKPERELIIATTRPETMLGDTAVAIHPDDPRYSDIKNDIVILPLINRRLKVICDDYVGMDLGTGCLKVTPAHDPNDFVIGRRHNLEEINIFTEDGLINSNGGTYKGLDRFICREKIVQDLEKENRLVKIEPHTHAIGHCYRCHTIVEPYLSKQWFVKTKPLALRAIKAVREKKIRILPEHWEKTYYKWMEEIRDWCISRQIWWGHRIPAWYCRGNDKNQCKLGCENPIVARTKPDKCPVCGSRDLVQDPDVLDTWFSSALWPFTTLGWPLATPELKKYYPTSCLVTGFDILFFWVARMIMMGLEFMDDVPFRDVYIHALVRDAEGKKMSKSKGNVIDPLEVIDRHGADAFRFTLASLATPGRDVLLSETRIAGYRHFCNKIWNATRFILMYKEKFKDVTPGPMKMMDKWIVSRKGMVINAVENAILTYRFDDAAHELYHFFWHEFCDWYLELIKPRITGKDESDAAISIKTFINVLSEMLKCLHPLTPFITEELMRYINPDNKTPLTRQPWPLFSSSDIDIEAEKKMNTIMSLTNTIRSLRSDLSIPPTKELQVFIVAVEPEDIIDYVNDIGLLARANPIEVKRSPFSYPHSIHIFVSSYDIIIPLEGNVDIGKEITKCKKEIDNLDKLLENINKKLQNEGFLKNAAEEVIDETRAKSVDIDNRLNRWREHLKRLEEATLS